MSSTINSLITLKFGRKLVLILRTTQKPTAHLELVPPHLQTSCSTQFGKHWSVLLMWQK